MRFDEIKNKSAWEILKLLQKKTRQNAELIKENSNLIQLALKGEVEFTNGSYDVAIIQAENNKIIQENRDYLKLHNQLLGFLKNASKPEEHYTVRNLEEPEEEKVNPKTKTLTFSIDEYFDQTINGLIEYDAKHPYYTSEDFRNRLLEYFTEKEEYEKCAYLVRK